MHVMAVQDYNYDAAQRQLNTWTWSVSSELEGDVSTSCYEHVGALWDYSYVYQVKPECRCFKNTCACYIPSSILHKSD